MSIFLRSGPTEVESRDIVDREHPSILLCLIPVHIRPEDHQENGFPAGHQTRTQYRHSLFNFLKACHLPPEDQAILRILKVNQIYWSAFINVTRDELRALGFAFGLSANCGSNAKDLG
ncbi:hypothetical protein VP01_3136g1 [Puccinia sorghi]|uniref:Uncharacterized protein n=1 Tax=Puccinia sorghi TaxID=27349 RepID=A0A0L6V0V8_9BASI|nr:hypothetical protein VP01_3136g1 [Puccinia sorghi]